MIRSLFIFLLSAIYSSSYADSPPCWCPFEDQSANKKYVAIVTRPKEDSLVDPWTSIWTLSVYERAGKHKRLLWKMTYDYTGYPHGILSNDGKTFTYIHFWYRSHTPLVHIYRQGQKINTLGLIGRNFRIPIHKLQPTSSHHLWLALEKAPYHYYTDNNHLFVKINTIDGKSHYIDTLTGQSVPLDSYRD
jgi:hypothetical protein